MNGSAAAAAEELRALTSSAVLQARLEIASRQLRATRIVVGLLYQGRIGCAAVPERGSSASDAPERSPFRPGCIAKLFTSVLVLNAVRAGELRLDDMCATLLREPRHATLEALRGVTVKELLDHTHGLDDSRGVGTPFLDDGYIDVAALATRVASARRLAPPGLLYSYSDIGARLLAGMLEHIYRQPYAEVLAAKLFEPLGIETPPTAATPRGEPGRVCPSTGRGLTIAVGDLLRFLDVHGLRESVAGSEPGPSTAAAAVALPGWNSLEDGVQVGWKCYGSGWIGHNSDPPGPAAMARVRPRERIAIAIESADRSAAPVVAALFGKLLPELVRLRTPRPMSVQEREAVQVERYVGRYENGAMSVAVERAADSSLELRAYRREAGAKEATPFAVTRLRPARDHIFFPTEPLGTPIFPFVQYLGEAGGTFRYLWNGKNIWPAAADSHRSGGD